MIWDIRLFALCEDQRRALVDGCEGVSHSYGIKGREMSDSKDGRYTATMSQQQYSMCGVSVDTQWSQWLLNMKRAWIGDL